MLRNLCISLSLALVVAASGARADDAKEPAAKAQPADAPAPAETAPAETAPAAPASGADTDDVVDAPPPGVDGDDDEGDAIEEAAPAPVAALLDVAHFELAVPEDADRRWLAEATKVEMALRTALRSLPGVSLRSSAAAPLNKTCLDDAGCRQEAAAERGGPVNVAGQLRGGQGTPLTLAVVVFDRVGVELGASTAEAASADAMVAEKLEAVIADVATALEKAPRPTQDVAEKGGPRRFWSENDGSEGKKPGEKPRLDASAAPPPAMEEPESEFPPYLGLAWTGGFVAGGAVVAAAGVGFDLFSPTSVNDTVDAFDFIGPALVVIGGAVAIVGLVVNPFAEEGDDA